MVDMDNCVSTGRVSGLQGGPASVTGPAQHDRQPFFHLQINHNSTTANKSMHWEPPAWTWPAQFQYYFLGKEVSFEKLIPKCWLKFGSLDESIKRFHFLMRDSKRLCNILKILLIFFIWQSINTYRGGCWINIREDVCQFWILISNLEYIPGIFLSYLLQWIAKFCNIRITEIETGILEIFSNWDCIIV